MIKSKVVYLEVSKNMLNIPLPSSISYLWNFGSLLGLCLLTQVISGLFLAMHFEASVDKSFTSVIMIMNDVNSGWLIRFIHANGASMFFILVYLHIGRGLYYSSYTLFKPWMIGVSMLLVLMGTAFLGYVLPWGQMSFWGATVITNLLSAVPYLGVNLVEWIWGGFSVDNPTLVRMFSLHFIMPFIILMMALMHVISLHSTGSSNPLGLNTDRDKIPFHPYFSSKDLLGVVLYMMIFMTIVFQYPNMFMDPENFIPANPLMTPVHIQPEWYFLFAYSILRSIPSKLGGVIALFSSIAILYMMPFYSKKSGMFNILTKWLTWVQVVNFLLLTWLGSMPVCYPFIQMSMMVALSYFMVYFIWSLASLL